MYDADSSLSELIQIARSRLGPAAAPEPGSGSGLDCVGFVCLDSDAVATGTSRAILGPVDGDDERARFWQGIGVRARAARVGRSRADAGRSAPPARLADCARAVRAAPRAQQFLRSGTGRQLHVFTNMCDAPPQSVFVDMERKQRLARASIRACDMNTMVTPNSRGVTARFHSTAGMYFGEVGVVNWTSSLRATRVAVQRMADGARAAGPLGFLCRTDIFSSLWKRPRAAPRRGGGRDAAPGPPADPGA